MLYKLVKRLAARPAVFSSYTARELWTCPHIARQMLAAHLDPLDDRASYRTATIESSVEWIDTELKLDGKRVCDLGCGPGLYTKRFAALGARVTGVDFSAESLVYANKYSQNEAQPVRYIEADYVADDLPERFDIVTLISTDYCVLSPEQRARLLQNIRKMLNPSGTLVMDVAGVNAMAGKSEQTIIEDRLMGGFWAEGDYVGLMKTILYPDELVSLDHYLIVEPEEAWEIFNWMQYFTPVALTAELERAGFVVDRVSDGLSGLPLTQTSQVLGVSASLKS